MYSKLSHHVHMFELMRHVELYMLDINKLLELIILHRNDKLPSVSLAVSNTPDV